MQAYVIDPTKPPQQVLQRQTDRAAPPLSSDQVLVRVRAASLNYRDLLIADGQYGARAASPVVPLSDAAGEVVEVGAEVTRFRLGDRVAGIFFPNWIDAGPTPETLARTLGSTRDGVLAEYVAFDQSALVRVPDGLSFEEASTLPCAGVAAWHALLEGTPIRAGESVALMGTGGVSTFALQLAKAVGARVALVSGCDEKIDAACHLGADYLINYRRVHDWDQALLDWTQGEGVDRIVEVGGANTLAKSINAVRVGGHISLVGVLAGVSGYVDPLPLLSKLVRLQGVCVGSRAMFDSLNRAMSVNRIKPVISKIFPFAEAAAAYDYLRNAQHIGKVVVAF